MSETQEIIETGSISIDPIFQEELDKQGIKIIPPRKYDIPSSYDTKKFGRDSEIIGKAIEMYKDYLSHPIISDNFSSHPERRIWRSDTYQKIKAEHGEDKAREFDLLISRNKMKRNQLSTLLTFTDFISDDLDTELVDKLINKQIRPIAPKGFVDKDPWDGPTTPEKIQKVEEISETVAEILRYLGKKE